jgi:hypothetical protein
MYFTTVAFVLFFGTLTAQETEENAPGSLSHFSRLIGGEWHMGDSFQVFEWGVGGMSVKSKGYFVIEGKAKLVSEGVWFWHPGTNKLKGYSTAIDMPVSFFDYTTSFHGNKMKSALASYTPQGIEQNYIETLEFTDDDHYIWTLYATTAEGKTKIMGGKYERTDNTQQD